MDLAFAPDGRRLVSCDTSGFVRVWGTRSSAQLAPARLAAHRLRRRAAPLVDAERMGYSGGSYGAAMGGLLAGVEKRIKAYVVMKGDIKGITGYDLIKWCRETLVSYKVPHYIEFRDMLPKSKVGKLLRREIRSEEMRRKETQ